jgi:hypothetical protein
MKTHLLAGTRLVEHYQSTDNHGFHHFRKKNILKAINWSELKSEKKDQSELHLHHTKH